MKLFIFIACFSCGLLNVFAQHPQVPIILHTRQNMALKIDTVLTFPDTSAHIAKTSLESANAPLNDTSITFEAKPSVTFAIFPFPVRDNMRLFIENASAYPTMELIISNENGTTVIKKTITINGAPVPVKTADLPAGTYRAYLVANKRIVGTNEFEIYR